MCHFAMGNTRCYKTTVFTFIKQINNSSSHAAINIVLLFQLHQVNVLMSVTLENTRCRDVQMWNGLIFISANFSE